MLLPVAFFMVCPSSLWLWPTDVFSDEFIPSQLLMINHNTLAQYWVPFGHISFYQRVDLDEVMGQAFHGSSLVREMSKGNPATDRVWS